MVAPLSLYFLSLHLATCLKSSAAAAAFTSSASSTSAFRPAFTHQTRCNRHHECAFITTTSSSSSSSSSATSRRRHAGQFTSLSRQRFHSRSSLFGKDKYASETKKESQQDLLIGLESKLDYDGRIPSKVQQPTDDDSSSGDDGDDSPEQTAAASNNNNPHRCALLTILGKPNMGKSTLLNALLTDELAIATSRPQTTRHAILGVMTTDHTQLCLTDTPGIISRPAYRLQEGMMDTVKGAIGAADVFLVVTDVYSGIQRGKDNDADGDDDDGDEGEDDDSLGIGEETLSKLQNWGKPVIVCVNKVDLVAEDERSVYSNTPTQAIQTIQKWRSVLPDAFAILPTCAANGSDDPGVVALRSVLLANDPETDVGAAIRGLGRPVPGMFAKGMITAEEAANILPAGPPLYHPDFFTDRTDRFCASELIRETLFETLGKELPYCCEVRIETFDESKRDFDEENGTRSKSLIRIEALVLVERDSQKGIVVGKGGNQIKDVGVATRKKLQEFFGVKIFLELRVKVDKNWRNNDDKLKKFGYM